LQNDRKLSVISQFERIAESRITEPDRLLDDFDPMARVTIADRKPAAGLYQF
jgi:hypothetical protein